MNSRRPGRAVFGVVAVLVCAVMAGIARWGPANRVTNTAPSEDAPKAVRLFRALSEAGAKVTETDVTVWVEAGRGPTTDGELRKIVRRAAAQLGASPSGDDVVRVEEGHSRSATLGPWQDGGVEYLLGAQSGGVEGSESRRTTTLSIKARYSGFGPEVLGLEGRLRSTALGAAGRAAERQVRTFVTMRAALPVSRRDGAAERAREVVRLLGGGKARAIGEAGWESLSALASGLGEPVRFAGHTMNLNVAWHEDERQRQFYLVVGAPIITEEY